VDRSRDEFLPGPRLASDKDGRVTAGHFGHAGQDGRERWRGADNLFEHRRLVDLLSQRHVLLLQPLLRTLAIVSRPRKSPSVELRLRKADGSTGGSRSAQSSPRRQSQIIRWYMFHTTSTIASVRRSGCTGERGAARGGRQGVDVRKRLSAPRQRSRPSCPACQSGSSDSTVLITGETGTGKELVRASDPPPVRRASRAFISVNCAAIPRD